VTGEKRVLVTGGCGFIGSGLVRHLLSRPDTSVLNLDKLTYASAPEALGSVDSLPSYAFRQVDICDPPAVAAAIADFAPDAIAHLAAESHVDRSIDAPAVFVQTNVLGTMTLLDAALRYWQELPESRRQGFRFLHVSTDEVFGSLPLEGEERFRVGDRYNPSMPYAASKAGSDHLARAWQRTYGLPVIVTNACNTYGPWQFPEKLIPTMVLAGLLGRPMPVYGRGENRRDWIHVDDHAAALAAVLAGGAPGETFLVGGGGAIGNLELVRRICAILDDELPDSPWRPHDQLIRFVEDRPAHDLRYEIDDRHLHDRLGWRAAVTLADGLRRTVRWCRENLDWYLARLDQSGLNRRGLGTVANEGEPSRRLAQQR